MGNSLGHKITSNKPSLAVGPPRLGTFEHPDLLAAVHTKKSATRQWYASVKFECHIVDVLENVSQKQVLLGAHC